jgi:hypothetical protein
MSLFVGKARRLKQAKEEAQDEIEKYRSERERQFKEFEAKVIFIKILSYFQLKLTPGIQNIPHQYLVLVWELTFSLRQL